MKVRIYVHDDGEYLTLCPEDGRGDSLLKMPEGWDDRRRIREAVEILARTQA